MTEDPGGQAIAQGEVAADAGKRCRGMVSVTVRAFVNLLQDASVEGKVTIDQVRRIAAAVQAAEGPLAAYYARTESQCDAIFTLAAIESKRTDYLGRLITHSFSDLLDTAAESISRKHLSQFFAAIRMILGDEAHAHLKTRCEVIAESHRNEDGLIQWDDFYGDPEARQVNEQVLVTVARSFRRFDPRKDWFLIMMNSNPATTSLGSSVFVAKKPEDSVTVQFTEAHMVTLFEAMFAQMRPETFETARRNLFVARWGADAEATFGGLFRDLAALKRRL